jgi:hypothetical protein
MGENDNSAGLCCNMRLFASRKHPPETFQLGLIGRRDEMFAQSKGPSSGPPPLASTPKSMKNEKRWRRRRKKGNGHEKIDEIGNQQEGIRRGNENINRLRSPALQSSTGYRDEIKVNFKEMWFLELWTRFLGL